MVTREDALKEIVSLSHAHHIRADEIVALLEGGRPASRSTSDLLMRLFSYLGAIFILAGVVVYVVMFWEDMNSAARIVLTLGSGIVLYILAFVSLKDERFVRAFIPLLVASAAMLPTGMFVMLYEIFGSRNSGLAPILVFGIMFVQHGLTFKTLKHWVPLFFTVAFGALTFGFLCDKMGIDNDFTSLVMGASLLSIARSIDRSVYRSMVPFWYFAGSVLLFWGAFEYVENTYLELLFTGLCGFMIYLSTVFRSKTLLLTSSFSLLCYIGYFTEEYFVDSVGWPIALILFGFMFLGVGGFALKLKKKYM